MARHLTTICRLLVITAFFTPAVGFTSQYGIPGYSKNSSGPASCHACHTTHSGTHANNLTISGNTTVLAGSTSRFSILLSAATGQNISFGGFDLSTTAGLLLPADTETTVANSELVHSNRKAVTSTGSSYDVSWNFDWEAPASSGPVTFSACGLPVNGDGRATGSMGHGSLDGKVACTTFSIQVQQAPTANAGNNQTVIEGSPVNLDASLSSDPDGSISTYLWEQTGGTAVIINNANSSNAGFTAPNVAPGMTEELRFRLTVTDNDGLSSSDNVSIFVQDVLVSNLPPVADAGTNQIVNENTVVTLDASNSTDDGSISSYLWEQTGGIHTVTLNNATTAVADFTAPLVDSAGDKLRFQLTVTDNLGVSATDTVTVDVNDVDNPPTAKITDASGTVISAISNNAAVTLYGNFSSDPDGPITAYSWRQTAGPAIINPGPANTNSFSFTTPDNINGSISIALTVTGNNGSVQNTTSINFQLSDLPPLVDVIPAQTYTEGEVIDLHGNVSDPNNNLAAVQWRQINCGGNCLLPPLDIALPLAAGTAQASVLSPAVSAGGSRLLEFELSTTDSNGQTSRATTRVTVNDNGIDGFPPDAIAFTSFNGKPMAIQLENLGPGSTAIISQLQTADSSSISDNSGRPLGFPYELTRLQISLGAPGSVRVTLYFPEPVAKGYDFYQYLGSAGWVNASRAKNFDDLDFDAARGWRELAEEAEFSADRRRVSFLLSDGGPSDTNPASGIIAIDTAIGLNPPENREQPGATGALSVLSLLAGLMLPGLRRRRCMFAE